MCCLCRLSSCCCGLQHLGPGVQQLAVISLVANLVLLMAPHFAFPLVSQHGYQGWLMVLMASDVGLFLGARTSSRLLLLPWLITYAIHILFTCILGPLVVAGAVTVVQHFRSSDLLGRTNSSEGINGMLPKDANIQKEVEEAMHEVSNYQFDNMDEEEVRKVITTATLVLLPIFYLYTWLCTRSLYLELGLGEVEPSPGQRRPPGRLQAWSCHQTEGTPRRSHQSSSGPGQAYHAGAPWYVTGLLHERELAMRREQQGLHPWYQPPNAGHDHQGRQSTAPLPTYRF